MKHAQNLESKAGDKGKFYYKKAAGCGWLYLELNYFFDIFLLFHRF